jgi:hypothetical protein
MTTKEFTDLSKRFNKRIKSIVFSHVYSCKKYGISSEDLEQIGLIALWEASISMSPTDENFNRYAITSIRNAISDFVLKQATGMSFGTRYRKGISFRDPNDSLDRKIEDYEEGFDEFISHEDDYTSLFVDDFFKTIPKPYVSIIKDIMSGEPIELIAKKHKITLRVLDGVREKIREKYEEYVRRESD